MSTWRLLIDDEAPAAEGLATDELLMRRFWAGELPSPVLRLYTYRSHCALVGRFQDPRAELDLEACRTTGTQVNRRPTGGGAIVMGREQLGVALVTSLNAPGTPAHARAIIDTCAAGIVRGLARLGVRGELRGKNDIACDGRKIAGLGVHIDHNGAVLFHASVLADLDVDFMLRVLRVPVAKLADKAVASVRQRITTVSAECGRTVGADAMRVCVEAGFEEVFGIRAVRDELSAAERMGVARLVAERYGTEAWVMQRAAADAAPGGAMLKTPGGLLRISVSLGGDAIKDVFITGDFMARETAPGQIEAALKWTAADRARVEAAVEDGYRRGGGLDGVGAPDLAHAVWQAVVDARARLGSAGSCYYPPVGEPQRREEAKAWR